MKKFIPKLITVISIVVLLFALYILLSSIFTENGGIPDVGGYSAMRVLTGSMEPEVPTDSVVLIKRMDGDRSELLSELEVGDIITFYSRDKELKGAPTTHRIYEIKEENGETVYITKGDANALPDKKACRKKDVIGQVIWNGHIIGVIVRLLLNPLVFFPVIVGPLLIMILLNLRDAIKKAKELAREEEEEAVEAAIEEIRQRREREAKEKNMNK